VAGSAVRDAENGRELEIRASVTVDATGPWSDERGGFRRPGAPPMMSLRLSRGAHVTVPAAKLPVRRAVAVPAEPGRLFFAIPSGPVTLLGTTESDFEGPADAVAPTTADVASILGRAAEAFPGVALAPSDAVAAFAGLRPLRLERGRGASETSREEAIETGPGWVSVIGGKLTTHRRMGAHVMDRVVRELAELCRRAGPSRTRSRPFPGAGGVAGGDLEGVPTALAAHLASRYGSRAAGVAAILRADPSSAAPLVEGLPDCEAEVRYAARFEDARGAADVLVRRTHLFWQARGNGGDAVERVHAILARELGSDAARAARSAAELDREIERSRAALTLTGLKT
jgi:glycerol-3-phosphate dehydrogenase